MSWHYKQPVEIIFGNGTRKQLNKCIQGNKGLLITSPSFVKSGIAKELKDISQGRIKQIFSDITPNPDVQECQNCLSMFEEDFDFIVALGGGSVIDIAKVISVMAKSDEDVSEWMEEGKEIPSVHLPLIAIPTTSGTGSEVTCVAVISNHDKGIKIPLHSESFYPVTALIDPELTITVPKKLTACTGLDVLCHAIEAYWSRKHQPVCDALALQAIKLVFDYLPQAYANGNDVFAREKMAEASLLAGLAFAHTKTTSAHACSYPLTNILGIPHGEACALTIDYFLKFNYQRGCERTHTLAVLLGFKDIEDLAQHIACLKKKLGMLCNLKTFNISSNTKDLLIKGSLNSTMKNNPIEVFEKDLVEMYNHLI